MILATFDFPHDMRSVIVVVIEPDNLERMRKADPISLESMKAGGIMKPVSFPRNMSLLIAYEEDHDQLVRLAGDAHAFFAYLERRRQFIEGVDGIMHTVPLAGKSAEPQG